jgi:hypothetical protein
MLTMGFSSLLHENAFWGMETLERDWMFGSGIWLGDFEKGIAHWKKKTLTSWDRLETLTKRHPGETKYPT